MQGVHGKVIDGVLCGHDRLCCHKPAEQSRFTTDTAFTRPAGKNAGAFFCQPQTPNQSVESINGDLPLSKRIFKQIGLLPDKPLINRQFHCIGQQQFQSYHQKAAGYTNRTAESEPDARCTEICNETQQSGKRSPYHPESSQADDKGYRGIPESPQCRGRRQLRTVD